MAATTVEPKPFAGENRLTSAYMVVALVALALGITLGLLQGLEHAGINLYAPLASLLKSYYQGLTLHGVLNVLVWTTFFICGFVVIATVRVLDRPLYSLRFGWFTFWLMVVGLLLAAWPMLTNDATVMFTFYPPLKAHPAFYIGLALVVVGTWLVTANLVLTYRRWRAENPDARTPLIAYMSLITMIMWTIASLGIAVEVVIFLIPWSLGIIKGADPLLARTLFWFTGHPIVYFWLLPAYISWYAMVPKQAGGKLFSDPMARVAFLLFLILSTPVGFHHQYTDPGIGEGWKFLHTIFTFGVFFPSLLTFFNVVASLELGGRARGGKGWLMWMRHLPWGEPSFTAQVLAMIAFAFGGITGLVNASYNVNLVVHNTSWVPGHLHLTVGTGVTLSFLGILYWLLPYLTGKALWSKKVALAQAWLWAFGMLIFSNSLHRLGLLGMPRRTMIGSSPYIQPEWQGILPLVGIGGAILFISGFLFFLNAVMTLVASKEEAQVEMPVAEALHGPADSPAILDQWRPWLAFTAVLIVIAYGPMLVRLVSTTPLNVPGLRVW